jgi:hypothetical protein
LPRGQLVTVTRVSSRVEFPKPEFQWNQGDLSYIDGEEHPHRMLKADSSRSDSTHPS